MIIERNLVYEKMLSKDATRFCCPFTYCFPILPRFVTPAVNLNVLLKATEVFHLFLAFKSMENYYSY